MGTDEYAVVGEQRMVRGRGFGLQHVESGARQFPLAQRPVEQRLIHQSAAGSVDQNGAGLHGPEFFLEDHRTGGRAGHVE